MTNEYEFLRESLVALKDSLEDVLNRYDFGAHVLELHDGETAIQSSLQISGRQLKSSSFHIGFDPNSESWTRSFSKEPWSRLPIEMSASIMTWAFDGMALYQQVRIDHLFRDINGESTIPNGRRILPAEFSLWAYPVKVLMDVAEGKLAAYLGGFDPQVIEADIRLARHFLGFHAEQLREWDSLQLPQFLTGMELHNFQYANDTLANY